MAEANTDSGVGEAGVWFIDGINYPVSDEAITSICYI